jgi:putative FmdB family regulatory protein
MNSDDAALALVDGECQAIEYRGGPVPTYQYACTECGDQLEAVQSFSDPALTECTSCNGKLRKVFNSVGIVFKGSGFYRNDSRAGNVSAEKPAASTTAADSSTSTTSTPATSSSGTSAAPAAAPAAKAATPAS